MNENKKLENKYLLENLTTNKQNEFYGYKNIEKNYFNNFEKESKNKKKKNLKIELIQKENELINIDLKRINEKTRESEYDIFENKIIKS